MAIISENKNRNSLGRGACCVGGEGRKDAKTRALWERRVQGEFRPSWSSQAIAPKASLIRGRDASWLAFPYGAGRWAAWPVRVVAGAAALLDERDALPRTRDAPHMAHSRGTAAPLAARARMHPAQALRRGARARATMPDSRRDLLRRWSGTAAIAAAYRIRWCRGP